MKNRYFFLRQGKLNHIKGLKEVKKIKGLKKILLNYSVGSKIKIPHRMQQECVFVVVDDNEINLDKKINKIYSTLKFKINNKYYTGDPRIV